MKTLFSIILLIVRIIYLTWKTLNFLTEYFIFLKASIKKELVLLKVYFSVGIQYIKSLIVQNISLFIYFCCILLRI